MNSTLTGTIIFILLLIVLALAAYVDRIYTEMGKFLAREYQDNIDTWERLIEPRLGLGRESITLSASVLRQLTLAAIALFAGLRLYTHTTSLLPTLARSPSAVEIVRAAVEIILLILVFAVWLGWFPAAGRDGLRSFVLPACALGAFSMARIARLARSGMLEVLAQDHVRTARSAGVRAFVVTYKYALKNAAIPLVTVIGLEFGILLGGAVITETIFAWPGVGRLAVDAIFSRDYPLVQAIVAVLATLFVLINLAVDLVYTYLDPRIRMTR